MNYELQGKRTTSRCVVTRRDVLASLAASAATVSIVPRHVLGGPGQTPPSERLNIAMIGVGGQGVNDMKQFLADPLAQVVAVCDVRRTCDYSQFYYKGIKGRDPAQRLVESTYAEQRGAAQFKGCKAYHDFNELLERSDIDAVSIATPDHLHAVPTMAAINKGKHVYCQKPLTFTVREARTVTEAAQQRGVVTQMGHQLHATEKLKRLVELVQSGAIGRVREIHCWASSVYGGRTRPLETPPVPEGFDWDRWIGPAPLRPYHPDYAPFAWRNWRDFGTGSLGDFGCHILDPAIWAIGVPDRMTIEARSSQINDESWAVANQVRYQFKPPGADQTVSITWYDGGLRPFRPEGLPSDTPLPASGGLYLGDEGMIVAPHGGEATLFRGPDADPFERPKPTLPRGTSHYEEWVRGCQGGPDPLSNFSYAGPLTEMVLLGNIALVTGRRLVWDSRAFAFASDANANEHLHRTYRDGWTL